MGALDWEDILLSALYGGIAGPIIAAFVVLVWHWLRAPARIWADDQKTIKDLQSREKSGDYRLVQLELLLGEGSGLPSEEKFNQAAEVIEAWKKELITGKSSATLKQIEFIKGVISKNWPYRGIDPQPVRRSLYDLLEDIKNNLLKQE